MKRIVLGLLIGALCPPAFAASMTDAEIKTAIVGHTATWKNGKFNGTIVWSSNGSMKLTSNMPDTPTDSGTWRISGGKLCHTWKKVRKGKEVCNPLVSNGGGVYSHGTGAMKIK